VTSLTNTYADYLRVFHWGVTCDIPFAAPAIRSCLATDYIGVQLTTTKGPRMQLRRIYKNGHSFVITLSAHQLNHIGVLPGQYVRVEISKSKHPRLILSKALPKIQHVLTH